MVAHVNWVLPFAFLTLFPRLHGFDRALEEAAMDLGAKPLEIFTRIVFPIIRPGVIATALFSFSLSFGRVHPNHIRQRVRPHHTRSVLGAYR